MPRPGAILAGGLAALVVGPPADARAQRGVPLDGEAAPVQAGAELEKIGVDEKLGEALPLDVPVRGVDGVETRLADVLDGERPVAFTFAYHSCPVLCSMVLEATVDGLSGIDWSVGDEFLFVNVSIDPDDTPERARERRDALLARYGRGADADGWRFLTADEDVVKRLTEAAGFRYFYDARQDNYAHPAVVMLLTPEGKLARYLYGLEMDPNDLRVGLLEASRGRTVSTLERVVLYCYRYDPGTGKYVIMATRVMQVGGALTALLLAGMLGLFWRREVRRRRAEGEGRQASLGASSFEARS